MYYKDTQSNGLQVNGMAEPGGALSWGDRDTISGQMTVLRLERQEENTFV